MGPFNQWPTGSGFEHFYGFVGGEANQYFPGLYEGTTPVEPTKTPEQGYTLTEDLADRAITWVRQQKVLMPDKPFMMYFAPGATHAPHRPEGMVGQIQRQVRWRLGQAPRGNAGAANEAWRHSERCRAHRPSRGNSFVGLNAGQLKPVLARQMEIYAGFLEQVDHHVGRLVDTLSDLGVLDDTLIYYIIGDNGASAEGTINGCFNEMTTLNGMPGIETPEFLLSQDRRLRHAQSLQSLRRRLGARALHALSVDETGRLALGRHAQRHDRALAEGRERKGRDSQPVPSRHRRRENNIGRRGPARAAMRQQHRAGAARRRQHGARLSATRRRPKRRPSSISKCSATAASTIKVGRQ